MPKKLHIDFLFVSFFHLAQWLTTFSIPTMLAQDFRHITLYDHLRNVKGNFFFNHIGIYLAL